MKEIDYGNFAQKEVLGTQQGVSTLLCAVEQCERLQSDLRGVCDVLLKVSPEHKDWIMKNWGYLYERL